MDCLWWLRISLKMIISEKITSEKKLHQHLYKYYDVLHWGEDLNSFLNENITLVNNHNGEFFQFIKDDQVIGGLILYFNKEVNAYSIGCAAIDPNCRRKGHFKEILLNFNDTYSRLYFFCQSHLLNYYLKIFSYNKQTSQNGIFLISNYQTTIEDQGPYF